MPTGSARLARQRITRTRRDYNRWVANQTLEDYALRFTAKSARRWSPLRVANTALGAVSFLALEAIGGTITLAYGFTNSIAAIIFVSVMIFAISVPICAHAARAGVDVDLLTRGAGFGYIGSTITSLIYASFTFIFFGIEAVILASMLQSFFGIPEWLGYIFCAIVVVPLVTHGITFISRLQLWTQPVWFLLNLVPIVAALVTHPEWLRGWVGYAGQNGRYVGFSLTAFGAAASILFALITQTAEQVDFIRFLPPRAAIGGRQWWTALLLGGPGWIVIDIVKLLAGSLLAYAALRSGLLPDQAVQPAQMYRLAFGTITSPMGALILTSALVVVSQIKINVTNAYAGSLAWSNFFSRLTHSHPGRVVWLIFNIVIALLLMETGVTKTIQHTLVVYSDVAAGWMGALVADLVVNKRLDLSPKGIEFKRAHLFDINPVGVGAMLLAAAVSLGAYAGLMGPVAGALSTFIAFGVAFVAAPAIAWATGGRTYLARRGRAAWASRGTIPCSICEHDFEPEDMAYCPVYTGPICSLCCSLDARCHDACKPHGRVAEQIARPFRMILPAPVVALMRVRLARFTGVLFLFAAGTGLLLIAIDAQTVGSGPISHEAATGAFWKTFLVMLVIGGVVSWLAVLAQESRSAAEEETRRQTALLLDEISAHQVTDAALQRAKETAEAASRAKSRYVIGISHELRSPLNAILGYAQLLEKDADIPARKREGLRIIRRSGEHLTALIGGLLDISKIEAGRIELYRDEIRLPEFLDHLVQMMRLQAETKGIALFYRAESLPRLVYADEHRMRQVLINLLSNAIKFTNQGSVTFTVTCRRQVTEFEIADTGRGIAESDLVRIFEPFQRGGNTQSVPGTGLGLTIVRLLTEVMGGEIVATSVLGEGSRFRLRLLLSEAPETLRPSPPALEITGYRGRRLTVLVADDDPSHRSLMLDLLTPLGFTVMGASGGVECLDMAAQWRPDLFLLDLAMPDMTGWDLAARLREDSGARAPIVIVSANARELEAAPREGQHHDDVMAKPVRLDLLLDTIGRLLDLEWTRLEMDAVAVSTEVGEALTRQQLDELRELAAIGYVRGIRLRLDALAEEFPALVPTLEPLRALISDYRLDAFVTALDASARVEAL
ncbi:hybrid sensor histidine kinase/response regulator [Acidisoma cladoniae]|jgi:signal transduction histidine kinase/purine-cytosine permease-like protein/FixJ family two-component response regulator|uniref:hybrid sensor histidine kinase/response regulator n=1 Tax=Acidisoma cladoniae TaxID=3040935 RepID=UPI00254EA609|nr:ATP-binding protein [Acidisoma sp. PAMC 29798]